MAYDAIMGETVGIVGHDGDLIEAYCARPLDRGPHPGVVVLHHLPVYDEEHREITRRFAVHGYNAICPDLYSREASGGVSPEEAAAAARAAGGVPDDRLLGDVEGSIRYLSAASNWNGKIGTIGYCFGGRQAFLAACHMEMDAAINCYGGLIVDGPPEGSPITLGPILHLAPQLSCPLLGLFGSEDPNPDPARVAVLATVLSDAGKEFEFHSLPNAGHSFFAVNRPGYRPEAALSGWEMVFEFFERHLGE